MSAASSQLPSSTRPTKRSTNLTFCGHAQRRHARFEAQLDRLPPRALRLGRLRRGSRSRPSGSGDDGGHGVDDRLVALARIEQAEAEDHARPWRPRRGLMVSAATWGRCGTPWGRCRDDRRGCRTNGSSPRPRAATSPRCRGRVDQFRQDRRGARGPGRDFVETLRPSGRAGPGRSRGRTRPPRRPRCRPVLDADHFHAAVVEGWAT